MPANIITLIERGRESCEIHVGPYPHYVDDKLQAHVKRFSLNREDADYLRSRLAQWLTDRSGDTTAARTREVYVDKDGTMTPVTDHVTVHLARIDALEARLTCVEEALAKVDAAAADAVAVHDRLFAEAAETTSNPAWNNPAAIIDKIYDGEEINAAVIFQHPEEAALVRVVVRVTAPPHEKVGTTDARIIAEARKVLTTVARAPQGAGE